MKPPKREATDFERIPVYGDWVKGKIADIGYDKEHKSMWEGKERIRFCIRFKFDLEGCKYPHYSRWLTFNYGEKATLFTKYIKQLVDGAQPDMDLDIDMLKGMSIKTMWLEDGDFDKLEIILPLGAKLKPMPPEDIDPADDIAAGSDGDVPF